jgi:hypothetical protein
MLALGDEERHLGVPEDMGSQARVHPRRLNGWLPEAANPGGAADRATLRSREDPSAGVPRSQIPYMHDELFCDGPRQGHCADAFRRLWQTDDDPTSNVGRCAPHPDQVAQRVEVAELESGQLTDSEATERSDEDEGAIARVNGIGEPHHLVGGQSLWLFPFDPGKSHVSGGGEGNQPITHRQSENPGRDLPRLLDGGRRLARRDQIGDPYLEVGGLDSADGS